MYRLLLLAAAALAHPQVDESALLVEIFGTPPPSPRPDSSSLRPEDFTVRTTDASSTFTEASGAACKCLPYYLCDDNLVALDANNASVTGFGTLDIRFREDDCQESVERCCKTPKTEPAPPTTPAPLPAGCGHRNRQGLDFNLVGGSGSEALFGEFPWVVALIGADGAFSNVGSLIHPQVVITAAHVVYKHSPGTLKVRAGEWDSQTDKERLPHQERSVGEIYIHQNFHPKTLQNDVALLRLASPVELAPHVGLLCLPEQGESFEASRDCIANGWGKDYFGQKGRYAVILKRVELNMVAHPRCDALLKRTRLGRRFRLHNSFVCAGGEAGKDTCQGDGGAPLACPIGGDRYKLTGLVAWGIGCGEQDVPAVYAAVALFRRWVDDKMAAWGFDSSSYTA